MHPPGNGHPGGISVKDFIATYDIEAAPGDPHQRFLEAAIARGWRDTLSVTGQSERLPSNTLFGEFSDLDRAHQTFERAIADASAAVAPAKSTSSADISLSECQPVDLKQLKGNGSKPISLG
jgi:hypothetical protein